VWYFVIVKLRVGFWLMRLETVCNTVEAGLWDEAKCGGGVSFSDGQVDKQMEDIASRYLYYVHFMLGEKWTSVVQPDGPTSAGMEYILSELCKNFLLKQNGL
jgi:hypothetical protein